MKKTTWFCFTQPLGAAVVALAFFLALAAVPASAVDDPPAPASGNRVRTPRQSCKTWLTLSLRRRRSA